MALLLSSLPLAYFSSAAACQRPRALVRAAAADYANFPCDEDTCATLPSGPSLALEADAIVSNICCGLQHVDMPAPGMGLEKLFYFTTNECRAALTARRGTEELDRFVGWCANSQSLQPLLRCSAFDIGEPKFIPGTPTRGALATYVVTAWDRATAFRHHSGFERRTALEDCWLADAGSTAEERTEQVRFTLQQERRPPLQGCWLVKEILPLRLQFLDWD